MASREAPDPLMLSLARQAASTVGRHLPRDLAGSLYDDMVQFACLGYLNAKKRYKKKRGCSLAVFAWHRMCGAVRDGLRQFDPLPRTFRRDFPTVKLERGVNPWEEPSYTTDLNYKLDTQAKVRELLALLTPRQREVVELYFFKHLRLWQIGKRLKCSESRVCQILREAKGIMSLGRRV